jgi:hypothetical protein
MTEQEAFNDPEMKTILVLSGYVRELGEGKDYEETTYKTAKTIVKICSTHNVRISLLNKVKDIAFGDGSAQERMVDIKALFSNEA